MTAGQYIWLLRNADLLAFAIGMIVAAILITAFVYLNDRFVNRMGR